MKVVCGMDSGKIKIFIAALCAFAVFASSPGIFPVEAKPGENRQRWRNRDVEVTGRVLNKKSDQRFSMRVNGRDVEVFSERGLPGGLSKGDKVRVFGKWKDGRIEARDVDIREND